MRFISSAMRCRGASAGRERLQGVELLLHGLVAGVELRGVHRRGAAELLGGHRLHPAPGEGEVLLRQPELRHRLVELAGAGRLERHLQHGLAALARDHLLLLAPLAGVGGAHEVLAGLELDLVGDIGGIGAEDHAVDGDVAGDVAHEQRGRGPFSSLPSLRGATVPPGVGGLGLRPHDGLLLGRRQRLREQRGDGADGEQHAIASTRRDRLWADASRGVTMVVLLTAVAGRRSCW
jgi:hypothetical protein